MSSSKSYLESKLPLYLAQLRSMVEINSFTTNREGVQRLAICTAEIFRELGFESELIPSRNSLCGPHLFLSRGPKDGKKVLMVSHLDTVFSEQEEKANQFSWREEGERIYGPGTIDNKGGTQAIYLLLDLLRASYSHCFESTRWVIGLNSSEEIGATDFPEHCLRLADGAKAALVFEAGTHKGGEFLLVSARKGKGDFRVDVEGRGAHAGSNHMEGASALRQLCRLVEEIESRTDYSRKLTINVGIMRSGDSLNRVPHHAFAEGEFRAFDPGLLREMQDWLLKLPDSAPLQSAHDSYPCQIRVELTRFTAPMAENEGTNRLIQYWQDAGEELGVKVSTEQRGGLSDANFLSLSLPTVDGLGPAGKNAHSSERSADGLKDQEFLFRDSLIPKTLLNARAVLKLLSADDS